MAVSEMVTVGGISADSNTDSADTIRDLLTPTSEGETTPAPTPEPSSPQQTASEAGKTLRKAKQSYQERMDELHALIGNKDQAIAELDQRVRKAEALERKIAELEGRITKPAEPAQPKADPDAKPEWGDGSQWESYEAFIDARSAWNADQRLNSHAKQREEREQASARESFETHRQAKFSERLDAAKSHPDFDAVMSDPIPLSRPMQDVIKDSELAYEIMHYLHRHHDEAQAIYQAGGGNPVLVYGAMKRLEGLLSAQQVAAGSSGTTTQAKVSRAHAPIKPLSGGAPSVTREDEPPGDDATYEQHRAYWNRAEASGRTKRAR